MTGQALQFASDRLKNDFDTVKLAVSNTGEALEFASPELKNNFDIVKLAVTRNPNALQFASPELQQNTELVALANQTALMFASLMGHAELSTYLRSQARKRKRDDNNVDERETSRPRYTGREESQHFTNSSSSSNGGNEFDIKAIWKTNLFPIDNSKPLLSTIYKKKQIDVELFMVDNKTGIAFYHDDPEMDYKLTVNFKITGNKLDAELVIMESEKVIEEELCASPPKYEKPKRHCPKCQDASRYKNQMATTKPRKFKAGEIECYPNFKAWFNDLPSYMTSGKKKKNY